MGERRTCWDGNMGGREHEKEGNMGGRTGKNTNENRRRNTEGKIKESKETLY